MVDPITGGGLSNPFNGGRVGDFFAPFFTVQFQTYDRNSFTELAGAEEITISEDAETGLIVFSDEARSREVRTSSSGVMNQLRNYCTGIEIHAPSEAQSIVTLTIEPPIYDAIAIIDSQAISIFSIMVIEFGYLRMANGHQVKSEKHFFMVDKPELSMSGSNVTITLRGSDLFGASSPRREDRRAWPRSIYPTDLSIITVIAAKNRMRLDLSLVPETLLVNAGPGIGSVTHPLRANKARTDVLGITDALYQDTKDWLFFNRLVRENNCTFFVIGQKVFIVDMNTARVQAPSFRFLYYLQPETARDVPMETFSTNALTDLFVPAEAAGVRVGSVNPDTGEVDELSFDPLTSALEQHLSGRSVSGTSVQDDRVLKLDADIQVTPLPAFSSSEVGAYYSLPHGQQNRDEAARQPSRRASLMGNTQASVTIPGVPILSPLMVVRVEGVGRVFGGNYLVQEVTHRLSNDGYSSEVKLIRDTSTGDSVAGRGERPATGTNEQQVDDRPGEDVTGVDQDGA